MSGSGRIVVDGLLHAHFLFSCVVTNIRNTATAVKVKMRTDFIIEQTFNIIIDTYS